MNTKRFSGGEVEIGSVPTAEQTRSLVCNKLRAAYVVDVLPDAMELLPNLWGVVEAAREIMAVIDSGGKRSDGGDVADTLRDVLAKLERYVGGHALDER